MLITDCGISLPQRIPVNGHVTQINESEVPPISQFKAIWDTGATNTAVSKKVIDTCMLPQTGVTNVSGVHGTQQVGTFLANLYLPNAICIDGLAVTQAELGDDADILIGMDVIQRGDFAISNKDGITKFTFQIPSSHDFDFARQLNRQSAKTKSKGKNKGR